MTKSEIEKHIADFSATIADIRALLETPVLDGNPFVLALKPDDNTPLAHWPLYGNLYDDQLEAAAPRDRGFRLQRRFDLCGCTCFGERSALVNLSDARKTSPNAQIVHKRDWLVSNIAVATDALTLFRAALISFS